ncbi:hypothetical protein BA1DRAFT_02477 [Photorhabdus aegyptia]|uniref:Uncharacterized protein n=1 Tax=Photorhabdus aegyptia TaxID=2805098 RepID=A0A022PHK5_9GAMM|nr:hypothetical protein BA1DRAFT_02477 [Photorhabdus aegyptia]
MFDHMLFYVILLSKYATHHNVNQLNLPMTSRRMTMAARRAKN